MKRILDMVLMNASQLPNPNSLFERTTLKSLFLALVILCVTTFIVNRVQTWLSKKITRDSFARQLLYVILCLVVGVIIFGIALYLFATFVEKASLRTVINVSVIYSVMHSLLFIVYDEVPELFGLIDDE